MVIERLDETHMKSLALGATFLGSGGGGKVRLSCLLAERLLREVGFVRVLSPETFSGTAVAVGLTGAPQIDDEMLPSGRDLVVAVQVLSSTVNIPIEAIVWQEIGGSNALFAIAAAALLGVPLVDADTMGRAFPKVSMSTPFLGTSLVGKHIVLANAKGRSAVLSAFDGDFVDSAVEALAPSFGGVSALAFGPITFSPGHCDVPVIFGSLSRALAIGQTLRTIDSLDDLCCKLTEQGMARCYIGKVVGLLEDRARDGTFRAICSIRVTEPQSFPLRLDFQNEFLLLSSDGAILASVPDVISVLDGKTLEFLSPDELRYGQTVAVITTESSHVWRTAEGNNMVGAARFGYSDV